MRLVTLGRLALEYSDFSRPKPLLLLAYLALQGPQPRRVLADLFWMDARDPTDSLSTALRRLRNDVGGAIVADGRHVRAVIACDAQDFLAGIRNGEPRALGLYGGSFAQGLDLALGSELEEWVYSTREHLAGHARNLELRLAELAFARGRPPEAIRGAEAAFQFQDAPALEPDGLLRVTRLLIGVESPLAERAAAEVRELGLQPAPATPAPVPRPVNVFVGRTRELELLEERLLRPDARLVTLLGAGGMGKTRLALELAELLAPRFMECHVLRLESTTNAEGFASLLLAGLSMAASGVEEPLEVAARRLRGRRALLVLDNVEQFVGAAAGAVAYLSAACPDLRIVVTSRERLHLQDEWVVTVDGLPVPPETADIDETMGADSVRLFFDRAARVAPDLDRGQDAVRAIAAICRLVGGSPLAIELAASWARVLSPAQIARELELDSELLATDALDAPERHRNIHALFDRSWRLLSEAEQRVASRLAVFAADFDLDAARAVGADPRSIAALADRSLLRSLPEGRLSIHPLVRRYLLQRLTERKDGAAAWRAHANFFLTRVQALNEARHDLGPALGTLERAHADIRTAFLWAARFEPTELETAVSGFWRYLHGTARFREALSLCDELIEVLAQATPPDRAAVGIVTSLRAGCLWWLSKYAEGAEQAANGVARLRTAAAGAGLEFGLGVLGGNLWKTGDYHLALSAFEEALDMDCEGGRAPSRKRINVGQVEHALGNFGRARRLLEEAVELDRRDGNEDFLIAALGILAVNLVDCGEAARGRATAEEALRRATASGNRLLQTSDACAYVALRSGDPEAAQAQAEETLRLSQTSGNVEHRFSALLILSELGLLRGDPVAARARLEEAFGFVHALPMLLRCVVLLSDTWCRDGSFEAAVRVLSWVEAHSAAEHVVRKQARDSLSSLSREMPDEAFRAAHEAGRHFDAETVLREVGEIASAIHVRSSFSDGCPTSLKVR